MKAHVLALTILIELSLLGGQHPTEVPLRSETKEVLLDFVARDKHQKAVNNLRPEEVEICEDGVRQTLKSFTFRRGIEPPEQTGSRSGNAAYDPLREINLVSIVFESMSPESRRQAVGMVHEFLKNELRVNTWAGVFSLHHQLSVLQPYTTDQALLSAAVDRAGTGAYQQFAKENLDLAKRWNSLQSMDNPGEFKPLEPGSAEERGPAGGLGTTAGSVEKKMLRLTLEMLFQQEGSYSIDALRRLIRQQARLPGRKTVLFVSEGLVIPPEQPDLLRSVISEANRGNITFYTLDARGLDTTWSVAIANQSTSALYSTSGGVRSNDGEAVQHTNLQENARG